MKEELLSIELTQTNYVPKHVRGCADSEYVSYVGTEHKGAKFIDNKQTDSLTHSQTHIQKLRLLANIYSNVKFTTAQ